MMKITADLYPEGQAHQPLVRALKEFFDQHTFDNGLDWQWQQLWAVMTDQQCMMFCLKYPQYQHMFRKV